jgi:tRNA (adenine22-N1)-methyltransferase
MPAGARLADIGSDHGYLPVVLLEPWCHHDRVAGEVA